MSSKPLQRFCDNPKCHWHDVMTDGLSKSWQTYKHEPMGWPTHMTPTIETMQAVGVITLMSLRSSHCEKAIPHDIPIGRYAISTAVKDAYTTTQMVVNGYLCETCYGVWGLIHDLGGMSF